jgi:protein-disulfide isomerase
MVRKNLASYSICLFFSFFAGVCMAQSPAPSAAPALSTETLHRIQKEIRSHYNISGVIDLSVSSPEPSEIPGYDKLVVTLNHGDNKTTFDFLISKDRSTLARLEKMDISKDLMSKIDVKGRPVRGDHDAKVTIVNFDDFECPFCARMHATLFPDLMKAYGDKIKVIYKDFPLVDIHPWAMRAAVDANCLSDQSSEAYWDFADYVHANAKKVGGEGRSDALGNLDNLALAQGTKHHLDEQKLKACLQKSDEVSVRASMAEGDKLGVDSTPTLFVNGEKVSGSIPAEEMRLIIDRALADAGEKASAQTARN